jgi:uncharacterized cupin superfamily protein
MSEQPPIVVNVADAPEIERKIGEHWGAAFKILTPGMRPRGGSLGVNLMRVPKGRTTTPFHTHACDDELFELRVGDCVSCAAGTGVAHQIANPHDEELVYLAIGTHAPHEVCTYPDSGKVMVRTLQKVGRLEPLPYMEGEPARPKVFDLIASEPQPSIPPKTG